MKYFELAPFELRVNAPRRSWRRSNDDEAEDEEKSTDA